MPKLRGFLRPNWQQRLNPLLRFANNNSNYISKYTKSPIFLQVDTTLLWYTIRIEMLLILVLVLNSNTISSGKWFGLVEPIMVFSKTSDCSGIVYSNTLYVTYSDTNYSYKCNLKLLFFNFVSSVKMMVTMMYLCIKLHEIILLISSVKKLVMDTCAKNTTNYNSWDDFSWLPNRKWKE